MARAPVQQQPKHSRWSWRLGKLFGIDVRMHATFVVLLAWVAISHLMLRQGALAAAGGVTYVLAVFAIVVVHELAHALTARRFGIATREILLLPIGGVSRMERMPSKPSQELLVSIAGPAVNVALAAVLFAVMLATGQVGAALQVSIVGGPLLAKLMWTNVALAGFNLLPAFPMDGGRVLRSLLALRIDRVRATDVAAAIGQAAALLFGLIGLFFNPLLVFIALFVWIGAQEEAKHAHLRASLEGVPVSQAVVRHFASVGPDEPLYAAAESLLGGFQDDIPVVQEGRLLGVLRRDTVLRATLSGDPGAPASSAMDTPSELVTENDSLDEAFERLQQSGRRSIPVVRGEALVGLLPVENILYVLQLRERNRLAAVHG